jgi:3-phosphoshikimate 1-carboxyvinyltransferase
MILESDWTAASYAYSLLAMAPIGSYLDLPGLRISGWQGDEILTNWMQLFGIETITTSDGCRIVHSLDQSPSHLELDLEDHPDLAQTFITLCAMKGIPGRFTGLQTLLIKETNRTAALQTELAKGGVTFVEAEDDTWVLSGIWRPTHLPIRTYEDHRMAMAFSVASFCSELIIEEPEVVTKSFPQYWKTLRDLGFITIQG